jgi:hypothetical protein
LFCPVLNCIRQTEAIANINPQEEMGGKNGISASMDISIDLGNSTHYDVNDSSPGFSIWTETNRGEADNWFFVLPNILIRHNDKTYNGVAIRLYHGAVVSWDGRIIRHGTTKTSTGSKSNHTFGWFWSSSGKLVDSSIE